MRGLNITSDNAVTIMNTLNEYLRKSIDAASLEPVYFTTHSHDLWGPIDKLDLSMPECYNLIANAKAQLYIRYKLDNVVYRATLICNPQDGEISFVVSADIS